MRLPALPLSRVVAAVIAVGLCVAGQAIIRHQLRPSQRKSLAPDCPTGTVLVPQGKFIVGQRYDTGNVDPFCMDVTEVTVAAYGACVAAKGCTEPIVYNPDNDDAGCNWKRPDAERHPVNCVDWEQATTFCAWANKRLPREEEWEWAARGGLEARPFPWGDAEPDEGLLNACGTECVAFAQSKLGKTWSSMYEGDDGWRMTAPVGSFPKGATALGLQDMSGNVWEWTSSAFNTKTKVTRGGGWSDYKIERVRVAFRGADPPNSKTRTLGFRCAG